MSKAVKRSTQKKKLWTLVSKYIRLKYADDNGYCSCVTCGTTKHYKQMQAGHFIPKKKGNAIFFQETNIHPQCYQCNINLGGYGAMYYTYMLDMYGQEEIDRLMALTGTTVKLDYDELTREYQELYDELPK